MNAKKLVLLGLVLISIIATITGCGSERTETPISRTEFMMDTIITLKIYDENDEKILDRAIKRLEEIETEMSVSIENSDVNKINKNAGVKPVQVNKDVYNVLERAKYYSTLSNGTYEPTIGPLVDLWNITGDDEADRERASIPSKEQINEKLNIVDYNDLELMEDNYVYLKRKEMKLDLGGIAKGYAADEVKKIFAENGVKSAILDLGGNIYAIGQKDNGDPWRIGVTNPFDPSNSYIGVLEVEDKSIVTSGDYERYITYKGKKYHHIISPKTGYPSENEVRGVSIISDESIDGDALSTTLFILGVDDGLELIKQLEGVEAIFITNDKEVVISEGVFDKFKLTNEEFKLMNKDNY